MTLIAVTNPSDKSAESGFVVEPEFLPTPERILAEYGGKLEDGAQIAFIEGEGEDTRVWQYIATRDPNNPESIALRSNNALAADAGPSGEEFIFYVNQRQGGNASIIESAHVALEADAPLETYTVFGENDDSERFVAVVTAPSEAAAYDAGITAGCVDEGWESDVRIDLILPGDHSQAAIDTEALTD